MLQWHELQKSRTQAVRARGAIRVHAEPEHLVGSFLFLDLLLTAPSRIGHAGALVLAVSLGGGCQVKHAGHIKQLSGGEDTLDLKSLE